MNEADADTRSGGRGRELFDDGGDEGQRGLGVIFTDASADAPKPPPVVPPRRFAER